MLCRAQDPPSLPPTVSQMFKLARACARCYSLHNGRDDYARLCCIWTPLHNRARMPGCSSVAALRSPLFPATLTVRAAPITSRNVLNIPHSHSMVQHFCRTHPPQRCVRLASHAKNAAPHIQWMKEMQQ